MRRTILQSARGAANAPRHLSAGQSRLGFICATCRTARARATRSADLSARRSFTTSTIFRQQASTVESATPQQRETIAPRTHYEFFPNTFPDGPPPSSSFTPDLKALRTEYLQLQSKAHPDLARPGQKDRAEAISTRINEAYKTLQDPLRRAQYLLSLQGIDVEDESAKLEDKELLMEVMEAREAVEEVENEEDLVGLREENNERIEQSVGVLNEAFATHDMESAAREAIRLRYWMNIQESIHGWEKGVGGGVLHH